MEEKRYDLFELPPNGFPQWLGSACDVSEAWEKMKRLPPLAAGGEYLVRDFYSGMVVAYTLPGHGKAFFAPSPDRAPIPAQRVA